MARAPARTAAHVSLARRRSQAGSPKLRLSEARQEVGPLHEEAMRNWVDETRGKRGLVDAGEAFDVNDLRANRRPT